MQPRDLIDIFIAPLEIGGFEYMITGSIAATFYGEPRLTHDIDLVICLQKSDIDKFLGMFSGEEFYRPPQEVLRVELSRDSFAHFNLIHHETGYKADMYPLSNEPLHSWGFENRRRIQVKDELQIWLAPPEYVIVRKLQYFKEGGSQKVSAHPTGGSRGPLLVSTIFNFLRDRAEYKTGLRYCFVSCTS